MTQDPNITPNSCEIPASRYIRFIININTIPNVVVRRLYFALPTLMRIILKKAFSVSPYIQVSYKPIYGSDEVDHPKWGGNSLGRYGRIDSIVNNQPVYQHESLDLYLFWNIYAGQYCIGENPLLDNCYVKFDDINR